MRFGQLSLCFLALIFFGSQAVEACALHFRTSIEQYIPARLEEPKAYRKTFLEGRDLEKARGIRIQYSQSEELPRRLFYEVYVEARLRGVTRAFKPKALRFLQEKKLWSDTLTIVAETHFATLGRFRLSVDKILGIADGVLGVSVNPRLRKTAVFYSALAHELEHFIQVNSFKFQRHAGHEHQRYFWEFGATRAEWEFWQLVPSAERARCVEILDQIDPRNPEEAFRSPSESARLADRIENAGNFNDFHDASGYSDPSKMHDPR